MHYNLKAIIAVGNKVDSPKAVQFRKWANTIIEEYTVKGYAMDDERLKKGGSILTKEYFEQLLERIREIRLSERKFYQKITDIYATSIDYDPAANETKKFFSAVQNKLHYAVHGHTAAELIVERADAKKTNMGLTSWEGSPNSILSTYPNIVNTRIYTKYGYLTPIENWKLLNGKVEGIEWWRAYTAIKHDEKGAFKKATLENTVLALGTLYIIDLYVLKVSSGNLQLAHEFPPNYFRCEYTANYVVTSEGELPDFGNKTSDEIVKETIGKLMDKNNNRFVEAKRELGKEKSYDK